MAKGDDALGRKRKKVRQKRIRSSENAVSARVAAIIAFKRRRKSGKRRICEGMCFSLPTPDDPFNDRNHRPNNHNQPQPPNDKAKNKPGNDTAKKKDTKPKPKPKPKAKAEEDEEEKVHKEVEEDRPSKFLVVCLNAIRDSWRQQEEEEEEEEEDTLHDETGPLSAGAWGVELWKCSSAATGVLDTSGACATREQAAWLVSTACDVVARKEKKGVVVSCPFLLYLVPSQQRAVQVRSVCKPLKPLGIHSVSLHSSASIEHQMFGLKSCEPEFLIATPERLLELVVLKAIDISGVSMLVIDGLNCFMDLNVGDKLSPIRDIISGSPQITIFTGPCDQRIATAARNLLGGRITRLSINGCVASQGALISQYVHFCQSEEHKTSKVKEILMQMLNNQVTRTANVLLIAGDDDRARHLSSSLKLENCTVSDDSCSSSFTICSSVGLMNVMVKDRESISMTALEEFEIVLVVDLPPSVEDYVEILVGTARHAVIGEVHSVFCTADAPLAKPLAEVLAQCGQTVPEFLATSESL